MSAIDVHGGDKTEPFYTSQRYSDSPTRSVGVVRPIILPSHGKDQGSNP